MSNYELGNIGEDFGLQPIVGDEENGPGDDLNDETFGDTGPLNIFFNVINLWC